jgi:hypothetical protein
LMMKAMAKKTAEASMESRNETTGSGIKYRERRVCETVLRG